MRGLDVHLVKSTQEAVGRTDERGLNWRKEGGQLAGHYSRVHGWQLWWGWGEGRGEEGKLKEESRGSVSVGQGIFPCDAEDGWRMAYGVLSVRQVGRALWDSRGLPRLEGSRWHKVVKPAEWT